MFNNRNLFLTVGILALSAAQSLFAKHAGFQVISGKASAPVLDSGTWTVKSGDKTIIQWDQLSIGELEKFYFDQATSKSAVLNRVLGSKSELLGALGSNGHVYLINPHGILVGPNATIDAAGFIASTLDVLDENFLSGKDLLFFGSSESGIVNLGTITSKAGDIVLIARTLHNAGQLLAPVGHVSLGRGSEVLLKTEGSERIFIQGTPDPSNPGSADEAPLTHTGSIQALTVELKASLNPYERAIQTSGRIDALTITEKGGEVYLCAGQGMCTVNGDISASHPSGVGGTIHLLGLDVRVENGTSIDASGASGGGEILIGGDYQGGNPTIPNADYTLVSKDVSLKADATDQGNGGKIILWSERATSFWGEASARGGEKSGDGGLVEVSGKYLEFNGNSDTRAPFGKTGMLFLDPVDITISVAADSNYAGTFSGVCLTPDGPFIETVNINTTTLQTQLLANCVTIDTSVGAGGTGVITVSDPISWNNTNTLNLTADAHITISANIQNNFNNGGVSYSSMNFQGGVSAPDGVGISFSGGAMVQSIDGDITMTGFGGGAGGVGLVLPDQAVSTSGAGSINLTGTGSISGSNAYGIVTTSGTPVKTTGTGTITLNGTGGTEGVAGTGCDGIRIQAGTAVTSVDGDIIMIGQGNSFGGRGIVLSNPGVSSSGLGSINLTGTGASLGPSATGIRINSGGSGVTTTGTGNISLTGTGGTAGSGDHGFGLDIEGSVGSAAAITLSGTGGTGSGGGNTGVFISAAITATTQINVTTAQGGGGGGSSGFQQHSSGPLTAGGDITITGLAGGSGGDNGCIGIFLADTVQSTGGMISLSGTGAGGTGGQNYGISVSSPLTATTGITVTTAQGGLGSSSNGFFLDGTTMTSTGGDINITGTGNASPGVSDCNGIALVGTVSAPAGNITLNGTGGGGGGVGGSNHGIISQGNISAFNTITISQALGGGGSIGNGSSGFVMDGVTILAPTFIATTNIQGGSGSGSHGFYMTSGAHLGDQLNPHDITIVASAGTDPVAGNIGIFSDGSEIYSAGAGAISLTGTGNPMGTGTMLTNFSYGVAVNNGQVATFDGPVSITAINPSSENFPLAPYALKVYGGANILANGSGTVTLIAEDASLVPGSGSIDFSSGSPVGTNLGFITINASNTQLSSNNTNISSTSGDITFFGTIDGSTAGNDLFVGTTGTILFNSAVGSPHALGDFVINPSGVITFNGTIATTGSGAGNGDIFINNNGLLTISHPVTVFGNFNQSGSGAVNLGVSIAPTSAAGGISFDGPVTLTATPINLTTNFGNIDVVNLGNAVDGAADLTITSFQGTIDFETVGGITPLTTFTVVDTNGQIRQLSSVTTTGAVNYTTIFNTIQLGGDITTTVSGSVTLNAPVELTNASTIDTSAGGNPIQFGSSINEDFDLVLNAGAGSVTIPGDIGNSTALLSFTGTAAGGFNLSGSTLTTDGAGGISFTGPVTLNADEVMTTANAPINFVGSTSTIDGNINLTLAAVGNNLSFGGNIGDSTPLSSFSITNGSGTFFGDLNTNGLGGISLIDNAFTFTTAATATTAANAPFFVSNNGPLIMPVGFALSLGGSFDQEGLGAVTLGADIITNDFPITLGGSGGITLLQPLETISNGAGTQNITIHNPVNGTVAGAQALTVQAGSGTIQITADEGDSIPLGAVQLTAGSISLDNNIITNGQSITLIGPVILPSNTFLDTTNGGSATTGNIFFSSTVDGPSDLTLAAGSASGVITFTNTVGNGIPVGNLTVNSAIATTFSSSSVATSFTMTGGAFTIDGPMTATVNDVNVTHSGLLTIPVGSDISANSFYEQGTGTSAIGDNMSVINFIDFNTPLILTSSPTFTVLIGGALNFNVGSDVSGGGLYDLNLVSASVVNLSSALGSSGSPVRNLTITSHGFNSFSGSSIYVTQNFLENGGGTSSLFTTITSTGGNITFMDPVVLAGATSLIANSGTLTFDSLIRGNQALTASAQTAFFHGTVGATFPPSALSVTASPINIYANQTVNGPMSYNGNVVVQPGSPIVLTEGTSTQTMTFTNNLTSNVNLTLTSSGGVSVAGITDLSGSSGGAGHNLTVSTAKNATFTGDILTTGGANVGAAGFNGGNVAISSTGGNVSVGNITTSGSNAAAGSGGNAGGITLQPDSSVTLIAGQGYIPGGILILNGSLTALGGTGTSSGLDGSIILSTLPRAEPPSIASITGSFSGSDLLIQGGFLQTGTNEAMTVFGNITINTSSFVQCSDTVALDSLSITSPDIVLNPRSPALLLTPSGSFAISNQVHLVARQSVNLVGTVDLAGGTAGLSGISNRAAFQADLTYAPLSYMLDFDPHSVVPPTPPTPPAPSLANVRAARIYQAAVADAQLTDLLPLDLLYLPFISYPRWCVDHDRCVEIENPDVIGYTRNQ